MNFTVRNVPPALLEDFDREIVKTSYPGGRSEAIRDLMRQALKKQTGSSQMSDQNSKRLTVPIAEIVESNDADEVLTGKDTSSYGALLKAVWCPICGSKLAIQKKAGKKTLVCSQHGEMKAVLCKDPKAGGEADV